MADVQSKQESDTKSSTTLNRSSLIEDSSLSVFVKTVSSEITTRTSHSIDNCLEETVESIKSTEEICKNNECYEFKAIQKPNLYQAYFEKTDPAEEGETGEEFYLRMLKEQKLIPAKRISMCLKGPSISLQYYNLDSRQVISLCEAMLINEAVKDLNLSCNRLTLDAHYHLGQLIRKSKSLNSLQLQHCKIGPEEVELLASGLEVCEGLSSLDLSYNEIGDEGMKILGVKLGYNITIKQLNLSHNYLTHESGFALSETMEENMGLEHLNLSWNQINKEPGLKKFLTTASEGNENLKSLDLSWNGLGGDKIANIVKTFMSNHSTLQELNLSHNRFETAPENIKLAKGMSASESLQTVNLSYNGITADVGFSLLSNINPKAHLRTLHLDNLWVKQDFEKLRKELETQSGIQVIIEGVSGGAEIKGPDMRTLLLKRANFLGYQPKKNKKDFGWFLLRLQNAGTLVPVKKAKFLKLLDEDKIKYDEGMVDELAKRFRDENKKIDLNLMLDKYLELYPNTALPVPKQKKGRPISRGDKKSSGSKRGSKESKEKGIKGDTEKSKKKKSSARVTETEGTEETEKTLLEGEGLDPNITLEKDGEDLVPTITLEKVGEDLDPTITLEKVGEDLDPTITLEKVGEDLEPVTTSEKDTSLKERAILEEDTEKNEEQQLTKETEENPTTDKGGELEIKKSEEPVAENNELSNDNITDNVTQQTQI